MSTNQRQVIVIGAGYAGLLASIRLAGKTRGQNVGITLVNASDRFVERVRLDQFAAGFEPKVRLLPNMLQGTGINFEQGVVTGIDTEQHKVTVQTGTQVQSLT